jgi:hypothetical protein
MSSRTKVCSLCHHRKRLRRFHRRASASDGRQNYCRRCVRQVSERRYQQHGDAIRAQARVRSLQRYHTDIAYRERVKARNRRPEVQAQIQRHLREQRERNQRQVLRYLKHHPCVDCGCTDMRVLEFDHVRGHKTRPISMMLSQRWVTVKAEIAKCEVRCGNCHHLRHHPGGSSYGNMQLRRRVNEYKHQHTCRDCHEDDYRVLDFDHVRGTKTATVSRLVGHNRRWSVVWREISKCDIRCHNCHHLRHVAERAAA